MKKTAIKIGIIAIIFIAIILFINLLIKKSEEHNQINFFSSTADHEIVGKLTKYAIYGNHFWFEGSVDFPKEPSSYKIVLKNYEEEKEISGYFTKEEGTTYTFISNTTINDGIDLEDLKEGAYYFLIKAYYDKDEAYYSVKNDYKEEKLTYYTVTNNNKNKQVDLTFETTNDLPNFKITVNKSKLPKNVYDITIDPGHGGSDKGNIVYLNGREYSESELNLKIALLLKAELEDYGYKVAITRDNDTDEVSNYDAKGHLTLGIETSSKLNLAIHYNSNLNGSGVNKGLEIYVPSDINLEFTESLVKNITSAGSITTSAKEEYKIEDGIYRRLYTNEELAENQERNKKASYYSYIREVGGTSTYAYESAYKDTLITPEAYMLELGYITNEEELDNIINNRKTYAKAIALAIKEYYE